MKTEIINNLILDVAFKVKFIYNPNERISV